MYLGKKLARLKHKLQLWNKSTFGGLDQNVRDAKDKVIACELAMEQNASKENRQKLHLAEAKLLY